MKRILLVAVFVFISYFSHSQAKYSGVFELEGDLTKYGIGKPSKLMIDYLTLDGRRKFDSVPVVNGKFFIRKELTEPVFALLAINLSSDGVNTRGMRQDILSLFAIPSKNKLTANDLLRDAEVTGPIAPLRDEYSLLEKELMNCKTRFNGLIKRFGPDVTNPQTVKATSELRDSLNDFIEEQIYKSYVLTHPASPLAVYALMRYANNPVWTPRKKMQPQLVDELVNKIDKSLQQLPTVMTLNKELEISKATGIGHPVLDFTLNDTLGRPVSLSDYKGKYVFLDFWASWCVPCRKENPNVVDLFNKYKDKGFTVLSVSLDKPEQKEAWLAAIRKDGLTAWTHVSDLKGFDSEVAKEYFVQSIPTNFLIGPDGKFLGRNLYGDALRKKLEEVIH